MEIKKQSRCPVGQRAGCLKLFRRDQIIIHRLAAVEQVHIRIGADIGENIRSLLGMLFLHVGAVVDGDVFLAVVPDLLSQRLQQDLDILAGAEELAAVQSQIVTFVDVIAVEVGIAAA